MKGRQAKRAERICQSAVRKWQVTPRYLKKDRQREEDSLEKEEFQLRVTSFSIPHPKVAPGEPLQRSRLRLRACAEVRA